MFFGANIDIKKFRFIFASKHFYERFNFTTVSFRTSLSSV